MVGKAATATRFPRTRQLIRRLLLRPRVRLILWWLASLLSLVVYAPLRGYADDMGMPVHGAGLEKALFGGLPTLWLQDHLFALSPRPLEWAAVIVHSSWFFVPLLAAVLVTFSRPERLGSFFIRWITLQAIVLPLFALFPLKPPWMADHEVIRVIALRFGGQIDDSNPLAAMPSLHVAFPLMIALWFLRERWKLPGIIMLIYSAIVGFEVVFSGEHYVVDVMGATVVAAMVILLGEVDYRRMFDRARQALGKRPALRLRPQPAAFFSAAKRSRQTQRGQALIEFAFIAPIIFIFLLAIVDFGMAMDRRVVIQHAIREGERYGQVNDNCEEIRTRVLDQSQGVLALNNVKVSYSRTPAASFGDLITVDIVNYSYHLSIFGGITKAIFGSNFGSIPMNPSVSGPLDTVVPNSGGCGP